MTEREDAPIPKTFINEAIDYTVSVVVVEAVREETALARAHRRWGMDERKEPTQ